MAIVLKLGDVLEFNYIKPERTIILTTKTIIYELVVNDNESAEKLIACIREAMKRDVVQEKVRSIPKFYKEG